MNCIGCGKELSGGLDTYGYPGDEMCFACYFDVPGNNANTDELRKLEADDLRRELRIKRDEIYELEGDLEELQGQIAVARDEYSEIEEQLKDLGLSEIENSPVPPRVVKERLQKWVKVVTGVSS